MLIATKSGTVYEYDEDENRIRRTAPSITESLRGDNEWLDVMFMIGPKVGEPMFMRLSSETMPEFSRTTTPVIGIEETD